LDREIIEKELRPSYRIFRGCHEATPLGTAPVISRLRPLGAACRVAYFSPDYPTAFLQTIVRGRNPRGRARSLCLWLINTGKPFGVEHTTDKGYPTKS